MGNNTTKSNAPGWYSQIDFGKMESYIKSGEGIKVVNETMSTSTPAEKLITEMTTVLPQKLKEPYTI